MSAPVSAVITSATRVLIPGIVQISSRNPRKGFDHHLDPFGELVDRCGVAVEQVQVHPGQECVVLAEPARERLDQLGCLVPQPPFGQVRQHHRFALSLDEGLEHRAS